MSNLVRLGAVAGLTGGALWVLKALYVAITENENTVTGLMYAVGLLLILVMLVGVYVMVVGRDLGVNQVALGLGILVGAIVLFAVLDAILREVTSAFLSVEATEEMGVLAFGIIVLAVSAYMLIRGGGSEDEGPRTRPVQSG